MFEEIKNKVYQANMELYKRNLVIFTWGNVSERINENLVTIKPSGVKYEEMNPDDIVIVDMEGNVFEGKYRPSSDTYTHLELYKANPNIKGICHTHSNYATSFAQAGMPIMALGTTQADYFYGNIPCTRDLTEYEVKNDYEKNTGKVIIEEFQNRDYAATPGVLVKSHGVFTWGKSAEDSVHNAVVIEELAKMNFQTIMINPNVSLLKNYVKDKHYFRKHGKNAYYGQRMNEETVV